MSDSRRNKSKPIRFWMHHALVPILLIAQTSVVLAIDFPDIRRGISEQEARINEEIKGNKVVVAEVGRSLYVFRQPDNTWIGILRVCKGNLYEYSSAVTGGITSFIKRVAQYNNEYGPGKIKFESSILEVGEYNMIESSWTRKDQVLTISYFGKFESITESQWVGKAVPSVCSR